MSERETTRAAEPKRSDAELVADIVAQLEKGGPLNEPRAHADHDRTVSLADYLRREVRRSIDRVRLLDTYKRPDAFPVTDEHGNVHLIPVPKVTEIDIKKAVAVLRNIARTKEQRAALDQFDAVRQFPPEGVNALKHYCVDEAFYLMRLFSAKPPTGTEVGPFWMIAALLFEAVTGEPATDVDMKRSMTRVLEDRHKYDPNAFVR